MLWCFVAFKERRAPAVWETICSSRANKDELLEAAFFFREARCGSVKGWIEDQNGIDVKLRWLKWLRLLAVSAVVTTVPIAAGDYVLSQHAISTGQAEADSMAARYLARAETTVAEALKILADLRSNGHVTCGLADRTAFGMAAFNSEFIVQIGLTDEAGTLICGEPMGALAAPARLPVAEKGDPSVMLSVLSDGKDKRQAVVINSVLH